MDSLEAALKTGDISGVELTLKQLRSALEKSSIREIDPKPGERFDPHRHQAMAAVEAARLERRTPSSRSCRRATACTTACCARRW